MPRQVSQDPSNMPPALPSDSSFGTATRQEPGEATQNEQGKVYQRFWQENTFKVLDKDHDVLSSCSPTSPSLDAKRTSQEDSLGMHRATCTLGSHQCHGHHADPHHCRNTRSMRATPLNSQTAPDGAAWVEDFGWGFTEESSPH